MNDFSFDERGGPWPGHLTPGREGPLVSCTRRIAQIRCVEGSCLRDCRN